MSEDKKVINLSTPASNEIDAYLFNGSIDEENVSRFIKLVFQNLNSNEALLFLNTYGGSPDWAYKLAMALINSHKNGFSLVVNGMCKSSGTLVALGANAIRFGALGELGPLDIQTAKQDDLLNRASGLDVFQVLGVIDRTARNSFHNMFLGMIRAGSGRISTKIASKVATDFVVGIYGSIASKIEPIELGEKQRAINIAHEYGCILGDCSKNLKEGTLQKLIQEYPSHSFVIDVRQSKELFNNVDIITQIDLDIYSNFKDDVFYYHYVGTTVPEQTNGEENVSNI